MSRPSPVGRSVSLLLHNVLRPVKNRRQFHHRGALLTMLWNFAAIGVMTNFILSESIKNFDSTYKLGLGLSILLCPVAAWFADVYVGRYRMIRFGLFLMWVASILYAATLTLQAQFPANEVVRYCKLSAAILCVLGLSAFQGNILQFGVDQLMDASSSDISSYFSWYIWVYFLAYSVTEISQSCLIEQYESIAALFLPLVLTVCICADILFNSWLDKEPVNFNPLKQIVQVLLFAAKNRYPRCRSAISHWEEKPCSRIDLGKDEYGGPFTALQVEDVKTFLRILVVALLCSLYYGSVFTLNSTVSRNMLEHYHSPQYTNICYERIVVTGSGYFAMVLFIPLLEFCFNMKLFKCTRRCNFLSQFTLGVFIQFFYCTGLMALEVVGHHMTSNDPALVSQNYSVACMLNSGHDSGTHTLILSYRWIALPRIIMSVGLYCLLASASEFACAQSPYSMKGLVAGIAYALFVVSVGMYEGIKLLFQHLFPKEESGSGIRFGCGVWYYACMSLLCLIWMVMTALASKLYSTRRRDEHLHITTVAEGLIT